MLFNSLNFIFFFVVVLAVYYAIPSKKYQQLFLLLASYCFYASWEPMYLLLLLFDTAVIYFSAVKLGSSYSPMGCKKLLIGSIILLLVPLLCHKYLNFILQMARDTVGWTGLPFNIKFVKLMLPVGISFFTFQAIGYIMDVYKHRIESERNFVDVALFLGFFPQISAGPIGRAPQLIPQFKEVHRANYDQFVSGFKIALWGFFMKLVVGDRAGIYVDTVLGSYATHSGASLILATLLYSIQIYCDFAGYSFIAIGVARMMGFQLQTNFERPYFAMSVTEFWRRWHISLSSWFRDYLYIPLGGNRVGRWRGYRNIMVTFLISGLWHGAAYNFIIWGGLHGLFQMIGKITKNGQETIFAKFKMAKGTVGYRIVNISTTFVLCSYAWMIFRMNHWNDVLEITKGYFRSGEVYIHQTTIFFFLIGFTVLFVKDFKDEYFPKKHFLLNSRHITVRYCSIVCLVLSIILFGVLNGGQFIYFQF